MTEEVYNDIMKKAEWKESDMTEEAWMKKYFFD